MASALGAVLIACPASAQDASPAQRERPFTLSGTARLRYEVIAGQARAGFNSHDDLINFRTVLLAEYKTDSVRIAAELRDSRVYGGDRGTPITTNEVNALEIVQAFVEARAPDLLGENSIVSLQAGRFLLNLGSRRLVAADDYRNTTNGYTGLRADLSLRDRWKATLIYTLPQHRRPDDPEGLRANSVALDREGPDLVLWGGLVSRARTLGQITAEASFFHLGERDSPLHPTRNRSLDTASIRLVRDPARGETDFEFEGIVQRGSIAASLAPGAARQGVSAWFVHADIGYTFASGGRPRISLEYDHASGDRPGGRYGRFDTLFGMRRGDLSPSGLYGAFGRTNFISPGLRAEMDPGPRTDIFATARLIWLAARQDSFSTTGVRDATGRSGNFAGTQFDARVRHRLSKALQLEMDAVMLAKGRFLRVAPNAPSGRWTRYLSLNALVTF